VADDQVEIKILKLAFGELRKNVVSPIGLIEQEHLSISKSLSPEVFSRQIVSVKFGNATLLGLGYVWH
jgi:hypothetical protein